MQHRYQFQLDGKPAAPTRDDWETAFEDAKSMGYGVQVNNHEFTMTIHTARIVRIK